MYLTLGAEYFDMRCCFGKELLAALPGAERAGLLSGALLGADTVSPITLLSGTILRLDFFRAR